METDKKLSKDANPGEMTMRGTVVPDLTTDLRLGHAFESAGESRVCRVRPPEGGQPCRQPPEAH